jgi:hypothetical protein
MNKSPLRAEPITLGGMLDNGLELIISCEVCGDHSIADLAALAEQYGRDFAVRDIRRTKRCCRFYARNYVRVSGYWPPTVAEPRSPSEGAATEPFKIFGILLAIVLPAIAGLVSFGKLGLIVGSLAGIALAIGVLRILQTSVDEGRPFDLTPWDGDK